MREIDDRYKQTCWSLVARVEDRWEDEGWLWLVLVASEIGRDVVEFDNPSARRSRRTNYWAVFFESPLVVSHKSMRPSFSFLSLSKKRKWWSFRRNRILIMWNGCFFWWISSQSNTTSLPTKQKYSCKTCCIEHNLYSITLLFQEILVLSCRLNKKIDRPLVIFTRKRRSLRLNLSNIKLNYI